MIRVGLARRYLGMSVPNARNVWARPKKAGFEKIFFQISKLQKSLKFS